MARAFDDFDNLDPRHHVHANPTSSDRLPEEKGGKRTHLYPVNEEIGWKIQTA